MRIATLVIIFSVLFLQNLFSDPYPIKGSSSSLKQRVLQKVNKWQKEIVEKAKKYPNSIIINGPQDSNEVYLTFNDVSSFITQKILTVLKKYNVKASFFLVGENIENNRTLALKILEDGHSIFNCSWSYPRFSKGTRRTITIELNKMEALLSSLFKEWGQDCESRSLLMRPPYGDINEGKGLSVLESLGYKAVLWSLDSFDWAGSNEKDIAKNIIDNVRPGEIISMGVKEETYKALPTIIEQLQRQGYSFSTVDNLG